MKKNLDVIATIPLFNGLPPDQLQAIKNIAIEKQINKGEMVVSEGDEGKGFFVIAEGRVKVFKVSAEGKEQILHIFGPGQPFGEVPVFAGQSFPANAQAIDKARVWFFPRAAIVELITANPSLALNMLSEMSRKLRLFAVQIENLSLKEMPARLASYLIHLADEQGQGEAVTLKISKGQLASILGTIPETLSRVFAKLSQTHLIRVEGKNITLLDRDGLEDLAEYGKDVE
ncbi:MAG: Crp/Fnr family transcriptional regulator [Deltaproteobacteria bacterium]|jgi:CRP/FNR family transcriptional regulator|nr:Crp/Fnr family transcriptional regulator [Deltaproteobacteria bacterium]MBW2483478.1 Crp/Fnr family transcriptional regulator [Deltaproteobacteria bacterium]